MYSRPLEVSSGASPIQAAMARQTPLEFPMELLVKIYESFGRIEARAG
jgi:hypothetical protein